VANFRNTKYKGYILTYLLHGAALLEKLTGMQILVVKKFPAFYGTRRLITAFTSA
jgi:hypothetical protein